MPDCYIKELHYHWHQDIVGGVTCAECDALVFKAWVRCNDNRPVCDRCYKPQQG